MFPQVGKSRLQSVCIRARAALPPVPLSLRAHVFSAEADAWLCQLTDMKQHISDKTGTLFDVVAVKFA